MKLTGVMRMEVEDPTRFKLTTDPGDRQSSAVSRGQAGTKKQTTLPECLVRFNLGQWDGHHEWSQESTGRYGSWLLQVERVRRFMFLAWGVIDARPWNDRVQFRRRRKKRTVREM